MTADDLTALKARDAQYRHARAQALNGYDRVPGELAAAHHADFAALVAEVVAGNHRAVELGDALADAGEALERERRWRETVLSAWDAWHRAGLEGQPRRGEQDADHPPVPPELLAALDALRPAPAVVKDVPVIAPVPQVVGGW